MEHPNLDPDRQRRREEVRSRTRRRRRLAGLALAVCVLAAGVVVAISLIGGDDSSGNGHARTAESANATIDELESVLGKIVTPWPSQQVRNGLFRDPTTNRARPGFGPVMLGEALMREGKRTGDDKLTESGLRVVTTTARRKRGLVENPLTMLAIASAYNWAKKNLAGDKRFTGSRRAWEAYLADWKAAEVGAEAQACFADPDCFNNYKLIEAVAVLELLRTGVKPSGPDSRLADRNAKRRAATAFADAAPKAAGKRAKTVGAKPNLSRLGILADEPTYPLAYHPLSVMMLGRGIELLGDDAPRSAIDTFRRTAEALNAYAGPDGDVAFIGRAQQEIWALGAAVYAGELCGRLYAKSHPATAGRCRTMAARVLARISAVHGFGAVGVNVVPRFNGQKKIDRRGLDRYARFLSYNGMTALFLDYAEDQLEASRSVEGAALPLDSGGAFVDPERTKFATLRQGNIWFAVHGVGPVRVKDLRYDFGLAALKQRQADGSWRDVLRPRPNASELAEEGMGPALVQGAQTGVPWGESISADPARGEIVVRGGWRLPRQGAWLRRGVTFRYKALDDGVAISFPARKGDRFRYTDFVVPKGASLSDGGRVLTSRDSVSTIPDRPDRERRQSGISSAVDTALVAITRFADSGDGGTQSWTIRAP